jgi:putative endonuclease
MSTPWHVYIVRCARGALYTGIALDVSKRVAQHNAGTGARSVKALGRPVTLVHKERWADKSGALKREYQIKQMSRVKKLELIEKELLCQ